jgi:hypothetical protein
MTPASALLTALRESSLLPPEQPREAGRLAATLPSAGALTEALVGRGWLTAFQADELNARRGGALVVGSYVLLDRLASSAYFTMATLP